jgi:LPXTG-site transpeptidase (sortase) family protein
MALIPKVVFASSLALLVGVGAFWVTGKSPAPSSDLAGKPFVLGSADDALSLRPPTSPGPRAPEKTETPTSSVAAAVTTTPATQQIATPQRITIADLAVDARVVAVGLEPDGSMEIPDFDQAGWYHYGARPGSVNGSAVIAAHVDHKGKPGVFIELRTLKIGAEVSVTDNYGVVLRYTVTERFQVDKDDLPTQELFRLDGRPTLTLITCGGTFSRKQRRYSDNIIIRAVPLTSTAASTGKGEQHHLGRPGSENPGTRVPQVDRR